MARYRIIRRPSTCDVFEARYDVEKKYLLFFWNTIEFSFLTREAAENAIAYHKRKDSEVGVKREVVQVYD